MLDAETFRLLSNAEIFQGLGNAELRQVYASCERIAVKEADTMMEAGRAGSALYVIAKGQFKVDLPLGSYVAPQSSGESESKTSKVNINILDKGDCFGEYSLIDEQNNRHPPL